MRDSEIADMTNKRQPLRFPWTGRLIFIAVVIIFGDFVINIDIGVKHLEPSVSQTDVASSA